MKHKLIMENGINQTDKPSYILRKSKRAKYLQLRCSPRGLEVVVPNYPLYSIVEIERFIASKRTWIERCQQRFAFQSEPKVLPVQINLQAISQKWTIKYFQTEQKYLSLHTNACHEVTILGNIGNKELCFAKLKQWLMDMAAIYCQEELIRLSRETGLIFNKLTIRNNQTRWGSCSSEKHISLCCKLLLLQPALYRHVLLHELCHTKALNHGKNFWRWLERFDPQARIHVQELKKAAQEMPNWLR